VELEEVRREVHGNDERISLKNLEFGLRLHMGILEEMQATTKSVNGEQ
jgi:hypothetical protein